MLKLVVGEKHLAIKHVDLGVLSTDAYQEIPRN